MRIFGILACIFLLTAICMAEETEYFDWKGSNLYASKNYTGSIVYFENGPGPGPGLHRCLDSQGRRPEGTQGPATDLCSPTALHCRSTARRPPHGPGSPKPTRLSDYANASAAAAKATEFDGSKGNLLREGNLLQMNPIREAIAKFDAAIALDPLYKDAIYKKGVMLMVLEASTKQSLSSTRLLK